MKQVFDQKTLREIENQCTQDQPANCATTCPVHVDGRALCDAIKEEDFSKALQVFQPSATFGRIVSSVCEAPCEAGCKLSELNSGINIRRLEQASVMYGQYNQKKRFFISKKNKKTAVIGEDLFCLSAAYELAKKGYDVDVFSEYITLGEGLDETLKGRVSREDILADMDIFKDMPVVFHFNHAPTKENVEEILTTHEAVVLETKIFASLFADGKIDAQTLQTSVDKIFTRKETSLPIIGAIADGKKAATTVDRTLQGVSVLEGRKNEGSYETTLYTSLDGVAPDKPVVPKGKEYTQEEAFEEAQRCIHCECLECVKGCAYLKHYKSYPKKYVREIYNNLSIAAGHHTANTMINSCALCGQCKNICPFGLDMSMVCHLARQTMVETAKMPPSAHEFALLDMEHANGEEYFLAKHQSGTDKSSYLFFPGCQFGAIAPQTLQAIYADLSGRLKGGVGLMLGCCGIMANWAGEEAMFDLTLQKLKEQWEELRKPMIVTACTMCNRVFEEFTEMKTVTIWQVLKEIGLPPGVTATSLEKAAIFDACGARDDEESRKIVRDIARQLGYEVHDLKYNHETSPCCGYGGLAAFANRQVAREMTDFAAGLDEAPYLTYCINCRDRVGREKSANHVLELIYGKDDTDSPSLSQRRYNRAKVKKQLLEEVWKESVMEKQNEIQITLHEGVEALLDERMILEEDIIKVIEQAEKTKCAILDRKTNHLIASRRVGNVTFWVEYEKENEQYRIYRAYSHRMMVEEA